MSFDPSTVSNDSDSGLAGYDAVERANTANLLPFFLRAWWLRDRSDYASLNFGDCLLTTGPLWCIHSDPLCDAGNIDSFLLE